MSTRQDLLDLIYTNSRTSSFDGLLIDSIYKQTANAQKSAASAKKAADKAAKKAPDVNVTGAAAGTLVKFQPNGFYFSVTLDFALAAQGSNHPSPVLTADEKANWGTGFGNPLVNPKKNCVYVVRAKIDQLRVDPMIGGFKIQWTAPVGWVKVDPLPLTMYVEASSNPLMISRKWRSPNATLKNVVFRAKIVAWYP